MRSITISKELRGGINEDAALATSDYIAVSDGAGGGGLFADKWSQYLVQNLPSVPISDFNGLDKWIDGIWEPFYNDCEEKAKKEDGLFLKKFYDEGSFATLVAVWKSGQWISYGDSVAFCYDFQTGLLQHSFGKLSEFNNPPYLINCKDSINENGFKFSQFNLSNHCAVFAASDALAHFILMMYQVSRRSDYEEELQVAIEAKTKNSNYIKVAMERDKIDFVGSVINPLLKCKRVPALRRYLQTQIKEGLIGTDDYSFVSM